MEMIRGSLDDISRPASCEHTGSRVSSVSLPHTDRICPSTPFALEVLTSDAADVQNRRRSEETIITSSACAPDQDEEKEDSELQRAIEEMRRLDEILSVQICKEKEVKRQRKELQTKLWQELLQNKPEGHSGCAHEALNTRLFLSLEAVRGTEEDEEDFVVPVFETQVPDGDHDRHSQHLGHWEKSPGNSTESLETGAEQCEAGHCGASRGKKKQKDFVKRNIELASGDGGQVHLTQGENQRLAELLRQIDEEEEDSARGADSEEDMWAVSVLSGQGYTPEPSDLEQLIDIDSKMRLLLPVEEFVSVQSSYTNLSVSQVHGSEVGWKCDGDRQPGEKVLQDRKERRGLERRLQEIQQQLEILGQSPEMTDESPELTEEQLLGLLDECELTEGWSQDPPGD
ncbi:putative fibrous sheath-interacting protein 1 [Scophthalmus maximus]|uniref:Fibrous sheath-interacting protein 1 n=1 Tax=Scophthalmus maximus TaxID=52904 RepID=A0A2U9CJF6_SCOMX|nr:putative fibrous sheath-interacting protein 1 [Scophthalmus maximus]